MQLHRISTFLTAFALSSFAYANDYMAGSLHIADPVARATVPGQPSGAAYLSIENHGKDADKLIAVSSSIAKSTQIHTMSMEGDVMKMREVDGIALKPASKTVMQPGSGYHIMLIGLKQPLKIGDQFPLTLIFEKAGKLEVSVSVEEVKPGKEMMNHHGGGHTHQ